MNRNETREWIEETRRLLEGDTELEVYPFSQGVRNQLIDDLQHQAEKAPHHLEQIQQSVENSTTTKDGDEIRSQLEQLESLFNDIQTVSEIDRETQSEMRSLVNTTLEVLDQIDD